MKEQAARANKAALQAMASGNMKGAEALWILEHNEMMNKGIESMNGKVYKRYRIYEKPLPEN